MRAGWVVSVIPDLMIIFYFSAGVGRSWVAKETPQVVAGTVSKLVQRLTFHRVIGKEGGIME